jgi:hypothetical protein
MDLCSPWKHPGAKEVSARPTGQKPPSLEPEQRQVILAYQGGLCPVCGHALTETGYMKPQLDHCHKTGRVRGLLCRKCNAAVGRYESREAERLNIVRYLENT